MAETVPPLARRCCCHPLIEEPDSDCPAHSMEADPREFRRGWDAAVRGEQRPSWQSGRWLAGYDDLMRERAKDAPAAGEPQEDTDG